VDGQVRTLDRERLYEEISACRKCSDGCNTIEALHRAGKFGFHWKSYWYGAAPLEYVFLAWEPTLQDAKRYAGEQQPVCPFNEPLHFAIRTFLSCSRYLITNTAKCSIQTGPTRDETKTFRCTECSVFLMREMELAKAGGSIPTIVAVGKELRDFIQQHQDLYRTIIGEHVHVITHFGKMASPHFSKFATQREAEFRDFRETIGKEYEAWLSDPQGGGGEFWWRQEAFERNPNLDLWRLFRWSHEMRAIRERPRN